MDGDRNQRVDTDESSHHGHQFDVAGTNQAQRKERQQHQQTAGHSGQTVGRTGGTALVQAERQCRNESSGDQGVGNSAGAQIKGAGDEQEKKQELEFHVGWALASRSPRLKRSSPKHRPRLRPP